MTERERLARIFGLDPLRPLPAVVGAGVLAPMLWIASAGVLAGLAALYAEEQRRIAAGLREVTGWGFPVDGYRAWLLAADPVLDLELQRAVGGDLIEAAVATIDPAIRTERRGDRGVRILMPRVELRGRDGAFWAGDRKRLAELHARVLAPLHADVGIIAMRMGDRTTMTAQLAAPAETPEGSFREQARVAPPDLQSLVRTGSSQRPPDEARDVPYRLDRLLYATGQSPTSAAAMTGYTIGSAIAGLAIALPLGLVGLALGSGIAYVARRSDRDRLSRALLRAIDPWPFPIEGYPNWLLSARPIMDIELAAPARRAKLELDLRGTIRGVEITWLSDTLVRVESKPVWHQAAQGIPSFWGGDPRELQVVARKVLMPVHTANRIVALRMGGYMNRRGWPEYS